MCTKPESLAAAGQGQQTAKQHGGGGGHGGMGGKADPNSFVQGEMRAVAMKLHTRDQAREGQKETQGKKFNEWEPTREGYLQFLVDSRLVYGAFDKAIALRPSLSELRDTGLERVAALDADIAWMQSEYPELELPRASDRAAEYASLIEE
ncbi:unnamed protein product, partial [Phaeothamnion confervicola]